MKLDRIIFCGYCGHIDFATETLNDLSDGVFTKRSPDISGHMSWRVNDINSLLVFNVNWINGWEAAIL